MIPTQIQSLPTDEVAITWDDGHESRYPFLYLRQACPCAACWDLKRQAPLQIQGAGGKVQELHPVGRYAISILWGDGHATGIYSFDYLRKLCPCTQCQP